MSARPGLFLAGLKSYFSGIVEVERIKDEREDRQADLTRDSQPGTRLI